MNIKQAKILWSAWILFGIIVDFIIYVSCGKEWTLSVYTRKLLRLETNTPQRRLGQVIITVFLGWLGIHVIGDCLQPLPERFSGDYRRARLCSDHTDNDQ